MRVNTNVPCHVIKQMVSRWRTKISFIECVAKVQNGWLTLKNPALALNLTNDNKEAAVTGMPSTSETGNLDENSGDERRNNNDSQELENFISAQQSSNTVRKTKSDMRALQHFCATINETREPETLTAVEC